MTPPRTEWKSPVSGAIMNIIELEGLSVHHDPESGGYWLERGELHQLASQHGVELPPIQTGIHAQHNSERRSPESGEALIEFEFDDHSGIKLDLDPVSKGIWLDAGELERIVTYLEDHAFGEAVPHEQKSADHISLSDRVLLFLYYLTKNPPLY